MAGPIVIIGSINMDLVCRTPRIPRPGETIMGSDFLTMPGGKGANQAVAAARLASAGITVHMIGRVGDDDFGRQLNFGAEIQWCQHRSRDQHSGVASGCALIQVDGHGENSIVVVPGANARVTVEDVRKGTRSDRVGIVRCDAIGDSARDCRVRDRVVQGAGRFHDSGFRRRFRQRDCQPLFTRSIY